MDINLNLIKKSLKENYNCIYTNIFEYQNASYVKALKEDEDGIIYKYFEINENNDLNEVIDNSTLEYFRDQYEENSDVDY